MKDILQQMRTDLRLSMSGVISSSMRNKGINYRMIFGVEIPRIVEISKKYTPDILLAETLWSEDVREMKIMATLLYPKEQFSKETALLWIVDIRDQEMREQVCKNILQELDFANELVNTVIDDREEGIRTTGYWLFARLCIIKRLDMVDAVDIELLLNKAIEDLKSESLLLRQSALNALKFFGRLSPTKSGVVLSKVATFKNSPNPVEIEMYDQLTFEFSNMDN